MFTNKTEKRYSKLVTYAVVNRYYVKLQLLPAIRQDSGELIVLHCAQDTLVF